MSAPQKIIDLAKNFGRNIEQHKRAQNETQVSYTDSEIDRQVYELYGLSTVAIKIMEGQ